MTSTIDLKRYDRQNRTYGTEATSSLSNSTIIINGLSGGLATESCKNLLLSGVQNIILVEDGMVISNDLETGFYYSETDIGKPRHLVLSDKLTKINPYCNITSSTFDSIDLSNKTVILHNSSLDEAIKINNISRTNNCRFIWVRSKGVSGTLFVDCLDNHIINDTTGEIVEPVQLESINSNGRVMCAQQNVHDFENGDFIKFTNLNGTNTDFLLEKEWEIIINNKVSFDIKDFNYYDEFNIINGTAILIKKPITISHETLQVQTENPTIVGFNQDFDKEIIEVYNKNLKVPIDSWSDEMNSIISEFSSSSIKKLVRSSNQEIMPVISVLGSLAAMEVIKLVTNKFTPVSQWMVYSDVDIVPTDKPTSVSLCGLGNLIGSTFQSNIESKNWLMVGCGAIGCEMLKNLAKLNIATNGGQLNVTDPDHIEQSNLSRQFLFRNSHIGKSKSQTASDVIKEMNSEIIINAMSDKMSSDSQQIIDDMAPQLFGVINALDNIEARRYMDEQCFRYGLPLFESGTQGMKGNTQPVIPFITETYSNSSDPPQEKSFPVCTIKNFPNQPHHTIHWAMDYFEQFQRGPNNVNGYLKNGKSFLDGLSSYDKSVAIEDIYNYTVKYNPQSWQDCAKWATDMYLELFRDQILQLLHNFPEDSVTTSDELFWSKGKRCPTVIEYNLTDSRVLNFLESTTHLIAQTCGLDNNFTRYELIESLVDYDLYDFQIDKDKLIASNDSELSKESDNKKIESNEHKLPDKVDTLFPLQFEKDDDMNWHVTFITAASNMRSSNYGIPTTTYDEAKGIAGKIIPAVATTTSIVAGLISMELIKYCCEIDKIDMYKSWFVSLANNILIASEPIPPPMLKFGETIINSWCKFDLTNDVTLNQFIEIYENKFNTKIGMVLHGASMMFANFMPCNIGDKLLSDIFHEKYNIDLLSSKIELIIASEEDDVELPTIQVKLVKQIECEH
jgi:ubiquitin-activating enzyme E1|uniref:Ubiquitin-activating enzyme E1 C-terminal domain-containing protein n=1 Tax=viral metagenome TaxID=1070528 RepID=A0A6C0IVR8_9ZZZZ